MRKQSRPLDCALLCVVSAVVAASFVWLEEGTLYEESQRQRLHLQVSSESSQQQTFKILQLADMHFGENSWTDWGPQQDINTFKVLDSVIPAEQPDLIVLSGDQITANNIDRNATSVYRNICNHLAKYQIPWAMIFGNHDDAPLETEQGDSLVTTPAKTSREDLFHVDHSFAPLSLTQMGPTNLFGTSNYILDVYKAGDSNDVALQLLFLDTGGGTLPMQLESNQVDWFQQQRRRKGSSIPMFAFQHIPTKQFIYDGNKCVGLQDDGVDSIENDPEMVDALAQDGNVHFLAVGHNHGNDYCCSYEQMHLCFGRHSGYGGYGSWDRGARIYQIQMMQSAASDNEISEATILTWKSWVRMESADIKDEYSPFEQEEEEEQEEGEERG